MDSGETLLADTVALARSFGQIAVIAGRDILQLRAGFLTVRSKADASPVTNADELAEQVILQALGRICSGIPVIAEESVASGRRPAPGDLFLLVDPLDGTREFVSGLDEFTVNIALIDRGAPLAGAVYAPGLGQLWCGAITSEGAGQAWTCAVNDPAGKAEPGPEKPIHTRLFMPDSAAALVSRSFSDPSVNDFIAAAGIATVRRAGSSLKFCLIAEGQADIYPRFGTINEWDIAAGDAVLRAAGGIVVKRSGGPVVYGDPAFASPHFIAFGDCQAAARLTLNLAR